MKRVFFSLLVIGLILSTEAFKLTMHPPRMISDLKVVDSPVKKNVGVNWCQQCVGILDQIIQELIEIVANVGVIGSCEELCSLLPQQLEQIACNLLCDYIGIDLLVYLLKKADIDPIWMCELAKLCPVHDGGAAKITEFKVVPPTGQQGATFDIELVFQVLNQTGTGEIEVLIIPPDALPFGDAVLNEGFAPGTYGVKFELKAEPSEQEPFLPGTYKVEGAVCYGECGSKHEHSAVLDKGETSFQITG